MEKQKFEGPSWTPSAPFTRTEDPASTDVSVLTSAYAAPSASSSSSSGIGTGSSSKAPDSSSSLPPDAKPASLGVPASSGAPGVFVFPHSASLAKSPLPSRSSRKSSSSLPGSPSPHHLAHHHSHLQEPLRPPRPSSSTSSRVSRTPPTRPHSADSLRRDALGAGVEEKKEFVDLKAGIAKLAPFAPTASLFNSPGPSRDAHTDVKSALPNNGE